MNDNGTPRYSTAIRHCYHTNGPAAAIALAMKLCNISEAEAVYHVASCNRTRNDTTHYEFSEKH